MTINIEELRKDMEAGAEGPYYDFLAREYIALREAADALADIVAEPVLTHTDLTWIQRRANAIAAYRKATQ